MIIKTVISVIAWLLAHVALSIVAILRFPKTYKSVRIHLQRNFTVCCHPILLNFLVGNASEVFFSVSLAYSLRCIRALSFLLSITAILSIIYDGELLFQFIFYMKHHCALHLVHVTYRILLRKTVTNELLFIDVSLAKY